MSGGPCEQRERLLLGDRLESLAVRSLDAVLVLREGGSLCSSTRCERASW